MHFSDSYIYLFKEFQLVSIGLVIVCYKSIKSITLRNFLNYELFLHYECRDLNKMMVEEKAPPLFVELNPEINQCATYLILASVKIHMEGTLHSHPPSAPPHTHTPCLVPLALLPPRCFGKGKKAENRGVTGVNALLRLVPMCTRIHFFGCSCLLSTQSCLYLFFRSHLRSLLFPIYYPLCFLYFSTHIHVVLSVKYSLIFIQNLPCHYSDLSITTQFTSTPPRSLPRPLIR